MTVGLLKISIFIPASNSLKHKRMVLDSLRTHIRNNFNVAVSQIDDQDKWQKATLALAGVDTDRKNMNSLLSKVINFVEDLEGVQLINYEMELM